jgi:hypothetical protein
LLTAGDIPAWAWNSLITSVAITFITVATSALAGYAFSRMDFSGRRWLYAAIIAAIIIPPQLLIVSLFRQMLAFDLVDTYWGIILPQAFAPAMVLILKRCFDQIPVELEDAARVDGANRLRVFWSITAGGAADREERVWPAICAEHGIRDPRRAAAGGRFPAFPTADHQGNRDDWFRWAVIRRTMVPAGGIPRTIPCKHRHCEQGCRDHLHAVRSTE